MKRLAKNRFLLVTTALIIAVSLFTCLYLYQQRTIKSAQRAIAAERIKAIDVRLKETDVKAKINRYERLDAYIDQYITERLAGNDAAAAATMTQAMQLAAEMADKTGEQMGNALVSFYRDVAVDKLAELQQARATRAELIGLSQKKQLLGLLERFDQVKTVFNKANASCELLQIELERVRIFALQRDLAQAKSLIDQSLPIVTQARYQYLEAYLQYWLSFCLGDTSNFDKSIETAKHSARIFQQIERTDLSTLPSMLVVSNYYAMNRDPEAFEQSYQLLKLAGDDNFTVSISLIHILGVSAFNLKYPATAERYLQQALAMAIKQDQKPQIAVSYTFLGLIYAEQGQWNNAENQFTLAFQTADQYQQDIKIYKFTETVINGYYARAQFLAGNFTKSKDYYQRALQLSYDMGLQQKLALSQLHQGLGECLLAEGNIAEAKQQFTLAVDFDKQAHENFEQSNDMLTFAPTRISSAEQLREIQNHSN